MLSPFDWLRKRAAQSIIDGVADGLEALDGEGAVPPAALERLQRRLALPAPAEAAGEDEAAAVRVGKRGAK